MNEAFPSASGRHLYDAVTMLKSQRWDNAVYLAGYVVECAFKLLISQHFRSDSSAVKKYGHNLTELEGKAIERLRMLYPILDKQLPTSRTLGTVLLTWQ